MQLKIRKIVIADSQPMYTLNTTETHAVCMIYAVETEKDSENELSENNGVNNGK